MSVRQFDTASVVHIPCAFQQFVFNIKSGSVVLLIGIDGEFQRCMRRFAPTVLTEYRRYRIRLLTVSSQLQIGNISLIVRDGKAYADQSGAIWDQRNRNRAGFVSFAKRHGRAGGPCGAVYGQRSAALGEHGRKVDLTGGTVRAF